MSFVGILYRKWLARMFAVLSAAVLAGCVSYDYVGQEFSPTPKNEPVDFYQTRAAVPMERFRLIGRLTLNVPDGTNGYDIQDLLLDKARSYGADAVSLVSSKRICVGTYEIPQDTMPGPQPYGTAGNVSPSGAAYQENTFGAITSLQGETTYRYEIVVRALFWKNREVVDKILAERRMELRDLEGNDPDIPAGLRDMSGAPLVIPAVQKPNPEEAIDHGSDESGDMVWPEDGAAPEKKTEEVSTVPQAEPLPEGEAKSEASTSAVESSRQ